MSELSFSILRDDCVTVPGLFEFRNRNQYVVGPGSIHPSGAEYRFWNDAPIVEIPNAVLEALREMADDYAGAGGRFGACMSLKVKGDTEVSNFATMQLWLALHPQDRGSCRS